jgi:predicted RNA-binding protein YlqC (UPF0109 family)
MAEVSKERDEGTSMNSNEHIATQIIRRLALEIILHPDDLEIKENHVGAGIEITIRAHQGDKPRLIGPGGQQFRALTAIAYLIGVQARRIVTMPDILPSITGQPDRYPLFETRDEWPRDRFQKLTTDIARAIFTGPSLVTIEDHEEGSTTITIHVSKNESPKTIDLALASLNKLLNSAGRLQGRIITVRIVPEEMKQEPQPMSADGRFARAGRR